MTAAEVRCDRLGNRSPGLVFRSDLSSLKKGLMPMGRERISASHEIVHAREELRFEGGSLRMVAVADTHGRPHALLDLRMGELAPGHILHAGDVGGLGVLRDLEKRARVSAVRGNVDGRDWPDVVTIDVRSGERPLVKILLTHMALNGTKLRSDVARIARAEGASLVVCGHSHIPFAAHDGDLTVFNPGSAGPRRFQLPIALGVIDASFRGLRSGTSTARRAPCGPPDWPFRTGRVSSKREATVLRPRLGRRS